MGYARHVGRVGALAVALGIGAAVATTPGVAWADGTTEDNTPVAESDTNQTPGTPDTSTAAHDPRAAIRDNIERAADDLRDGIRGAIKGVVRSSGGAITSTHRSGSNANNGNVSPSIVQRDSAGSPESPKDERKSTAVASVDAAVNPLQHFTPPRWRAPQSPISAKPDVKPLPKAVDDVKDIVQQSISDVTSKQPLGQFPTSQRNALSTLQAPTVDAVQEVRPRFVAPIAILTNVVNAALAPFLNPTPGQPAPQNPILWAVLGWVRRQVQDGPFGKFVLNQTPQITTPEVVDNHDGTFTITPSADDFDPDGDNLTYTAGNGSDGTVVKNDDGTFTYTVTDSGVWDETDTITLTASDEGSYPHVHGLVGLFKPGAGHTDSVVVSIKPTAGAAEIVQLPEGYTAVGDSSGTVGADGKVYRATKYSNNGVDAYALVVQRPGGDTEIIELPGEPIGELAFGPGGTVYQNTRTPNPDSPGSYNYAINVIQPSPAAASFALRAANTLDTGTVTVSLPGEPVGSMAIGSDGTVYQPIRPPDDTSPPGSPCVNCSVAIVLSGSSTARTVDLTGQLLSEAPMDPGSFIPEEPRLVTAGPEGTAYLTSVDIDSNTTTVWRVDASEPTITGIELTGVSFSAPYGATIGADGTAYITTEVRTQDGDQTIYDTKMWVIAPDSDTAKPFQLDGDIYGPVAIDDRGVAYVTTARSDFDGTEPVMIWRVDPTGNATTLIEVNGDPAGSVLVAPDGTAYQLITRKADPDNDPDAAQYLMAVIQPNSTDPTLVELGTFSSSFPRNSTTMTAQGTVYQVLVDFDWDAFSGDTTVFRIDGATHSAIHLEGAASTPVAVGPGDRAYVVTATNIDRQTLTGDETLWVLNPSSTEALEIPIDTEGTPVSLRIGGDSAFFTTVRIDVSDPNAPTSVYEIVAVTIPSQVA